ncbi:hypothetical protein G3O08_10420 [Cryomorpha ignava]|uniref:Nitrous oxide reductase n=1 Tax=Cryomorpha ignava TaxID=101383 RepID=A0A7K3WSR0_9FLAO|nr:nitrous oxide reductase accessory protein NosL [Cryomorpha ignava]NEN23912.1 hypothetical protein [Cryomorpha ignava]
MKHQIFLLIALVFIAVSCTETPEPINFGKDQCSFCKMSISDPKYGAELVTDKGRVIKYDALECMINDLNTNEPAYSELYAVAFDKPEKLILVDSLMFVISPEYKSPMGAHLASFTKENTPVAEELLDWNALRAEFDQ